MERLPYTPISYEIHTDMNEHYEHVQPELMQAHICAYHVLLTRWTCIEADFLIPIAMVLSGLAIL